MPRIVSLLPSATEIVSALGFQQDLVGRSHECDFPPGVEALPALTSPKVDPNQMSAEIDRQVRELVRDGLSVYSVDAEMLKELKPDVIVTQDQCAVCAVSHDELVAAVKDYLDTGVTVVSLTANDLDDVFRDINKVGKALERPQRARNLVASMRERMSPIEALAPIMPAPSVLCLEWLDPLMAAGQWMPELVALGGGANLIGRAGDAAPEITWDWVRAQDPDVLVLMPCGYDIAKTRSEIESLTKREGWSELSAVEHNRVFIVDGNHYFNRPGPRLADSLEILAEILHPLTFDKGHEGTGWEALEPAEASA